MLHQDSPNAGVDAGAPKGFAGAAPKAADDAPKAGEDIAVLPKAGWEAAPKLVKLKPAELAGVAPKPKLHAAGGGQRSTGAGASCAAENTLEARQAAVLPRAGCGTAPKGS